MTMHSGKAGLDRGIASSAVPRCRQCGQKIRWAKRADGTSHPPLTVIGEAIVIWNNVASTEMVYRRHQCRDEDIEDFVEAEALIREQDGEKRDQENSDRIMYQGLATERDAAWAEARPRPCPKCFAEPDEACENLSLRAKGVAKETSWPHVERLIKHPADGEHFYGPLPS
jgi:hypothetical protein